MGLGRRARPSRLRPQLLGAPKEGGVVVGTATTIGQAFPFSSTVRSDASGMESVKGCSVASYPPDGSGRYRQNPAPAAGGDDPSSEDHDLAESGKASGMGEGLAAPPNMRRHNAPRRGDGASTARRRAGGAGLAASAGICSRARRNHLRMVARRDDRGEAAACERRRKRAPAFADRASDAANRAAPGRPSAVSSRSAARAGVRDEERSGSLERKLLNRRIDAAEAFGFGQDLLIAAVRAYAGAACGEGVDFLSGGLR